MDPQQLSNFLFFKIVNVEHAPDFANFLENSLHQSSRPPNLPKPLRARSGRRFNFLDLILPPSHTLVEKIKIEIGTPRRGVFADFQFTPHLHLDCTTSTPCLHLIHSSFTPDLHLVNSIRVRGLRMLQLAAPRATPRATPRAAHGSGPPRVKS